MIISAVRILELNEMYDIIEGLSQGQLTNPEGTCLDLRVGQVHQMIGDSFLNSDETNGMRKSPETRLFADVKTDGPKMITLNPGDFYLVTTMERVNSPAGKIKYHPDLPEAYLVPKIFPRSSLQRGGVALLHTGTNPGWNGQLTFGIKNLGESNFVFEMGARMFSVEYHAVIGDLKRPYGGQHQGGRVTSGGKEEVQV